VQNNNNDVTFSIVGFFKILWQQKILVLSGTFLFVLISALYVYKLPDLYRAEITLIPNKNADGGLSSLSGQLGSLASLSGINFKSESNKSGQFVELSTSRGFVQQFIEKHQLLVNLLAVKGWDKNNNQLIYDDALFDVKSQKWRLAQPNQKIPTPWQAYGQFIKFLNVTQEAGGMLNITLDYYDPKLAKRWLYQYVDELNDFIRQQDLIEAQASIKYLQREASLAEVSSVKSVFYNLIEQKTKTVLLAKVSKGYVFKPLDDIVLPEDKQSPKRGIIIILFAFLGMLISIVIALIRHLIIAEHEHVNQ